MKSPEQKRAEYRAYMATPAGRAARRRGAVKYRASVKGRANRLARNAAYRVTEKGKAAAARRAARYFAVPERRFKMYQKNARHRGIVFELTLEQFKGWWRRACGYCNDPIATIGLDRIDNAIGYVVGNITSCCLVCNYMKKTWAREFFIAHCRKVVLFADL